MEDLGQAWFYMSLVEKMLLSPLNNFFYSLHALVHMAETADACLDTVEKGVLGILLFMIRHLKYLVNRLLQERFAQLAKHSHVEGMKNVEFTDLSIFFEGIF